MSGGHFDYKQYEINMIIDEVERLILTNDSTEKDDFGDDFGYHYPPKIIAKFKEALITLQQGAAMAQRIDWLVSDDDGPDAFLRRWDEDLKEINQEQGDT